MRFRHYLIGLSLLSIAGSAAAATLQVGPGQQFAAPCAAIAAAAPGDTILIAKAAYSGDVCQWSKNGLTLRGVNGRPHIQAAGKNSGGKGIWVVTGDNTVIENIEFSGATVPDKNGAAIRLELSNLIIRNCYIHNNQNGLLTNNTGTGEVLIEYSEFSYNGTSTGYTHNIYIGHQAKFTMRFSYSHHAYSGQLVKTRAAENHILYNRLTTENGNTSYEIDLPNGGLSYVTGNLVQQGVNSQNGALLEYMMEGASSYNPDHRLFVTNNTFVNDRSTGTFILMSSANSTPAVLQNNIFYGPGAIITQASAVLSNNLNGVNPLFVNPTAFNYQLLPGSPAIDAGIDPAPGAGQNLLPGFQYVHPTCGDSRTAAGAIDIGAYEFGSTGARLACAPSSGTGEAALASLSASPPVVLGGTNTTATALLNNPAGPSGITLVLSSSNGGVVSIPSSVNINAGSAGVAIPVTTQAVTAATAVTLSASYGGITKSTSLTVNPTLAITSVQALNVTSSSATISWTTNVASSTQANYGLTTAYGASSALNSTRVLAHSVTLTGLSASTLYHFRVLSVDATGSQAVSGDFAFTTPAGAFTITASPAAIVGLNNVTVSWTAAAGRPANDRITIAVPGSSNASHVAILATMGATSGTKTMIAPAAAGTYEVRYVTGDTLTKTAAAVLTVTAPVGYSVTGPASGTVGGSLVVRWTAPSGRPANDWIGLFDSAGTRVWAKATGGTTSGSLTLPAPAVAGTYQFRYYVSNSFTLAATAASFQVN